MAGVAQALAQNNTGLPCGDGAGGIHVRTTVNYGSSGAIGFTDSTYGFESILLQYLAAIWGRVVASYNGVSTAPETGTGYGEIGEV